MINTGIDMINYLRLTNVCQILLQGSNNHKVLKQFLLEPISVNFLWQFS